MSFEDDVRRMIQQHQESVERVRQFISDPLSIPEIRELFDKLKEVEAESRARGETTGADWLALNIAMLEANFELAASVRGWDIDEIRNLLDQLQEEDGL